LRFEDRRKIQDTIPTQYTLDDGTKFEVQKIVGGREDPLATIPFMALTWEGITPDAGWKVQALLNFVETSQVLIQDNLIDAFLTVEDRDSTIEWIEAANTQKFTKVRVHVKEMSAGNRLRLQVYENLRTNKWKECYNVWKWDEGVVRNDWTEFDLNFRTIFGRQYKFVLSVWDPTGSAVYLRVGAHGTTPIHQIEGVTGIYKRYGRVETITLDFLLHLGDIGLLGGRRVVNQELAWTIYRQIMSDAKARWDGEIVNGSVQSISGLRRVGSYGEETHWNFTVEFRYEHGMVDATPVIPVRQLNMKGIYVRTTL